MSARSSKQSGSDDPPAIDVNVGLLFVSLAAVCIGITFLILELRKYDWTMAS
ncbi:MAG: hypothetical protein O2955_09430 [Planctomycetota bacterium]|nr:hypothetical protein [Planctomycetota bacterium]MDA1212730.1 hypothetical protein [Planctomycetota bacterium]